MQQQAELLVRLWELLQLGVLSLIGGVANYFYYNIRTGSAFKLGMFLANAFVAYFVGMVMGDLIPDGEHKYGLLLMSGFCCYPVLGLLERKVMKIVE